MDIFNFCQRWARVGMDAPGVKLEYFTVRGFKPLLRWWYAPGVKKISEVFLEKYPTFCKIFSNFKNFPIFRGVSSHRNASFILHDGGARSKLTMGVSPHRPPLCPSLQRTNLYPSHYIYLPRSVNRSSVSTDGFLSRLKVS